MADYTQANRLMSITTPLGKDALLLVGFQGHEAISELFDFQLDLRAPKDKPVAFDKIMGQPVTVKLALPGGGTRLLNGIIKRFTQGGRDEVFTEFRAEMVPQLWLWTKKVQSRIFQHVSIPDILKQVLTGLKVKYEIQGTYHPRDYCVQYRESDFAFVSRLMEEEGIYYFFTHTDGSHEMIVTDVPNKHPEVPGQNKVIYEEAREGQRDELRIHEWEKTQELRSGQYTLWDHCFEVPGTNLEAKQTILDTVAVGKVSHKLKVGGNDKLEIYDYPGAYAQRFDGVDKGGGDQAADLQKIHTDNQRTVKIRMEQEALPSLEIEGAGNCGHLVAGHQFALTRHFDADGPYLLTRVEHSAQLGGNYRSGEDVHLEYTNRFTCIPAGLPYRPPVVTPEPTVLGTQTATVVGPPGEEIFCDKYGRVKVQFHWDRQGKKDADSSCWIRVAQPWAGGGFGAIAIPRVGDEVVVDFLEGDPDQPLVLGSVYNAAKTPPFTLPEHRMFSGIKANSVGGDPSKDFSGLSFNDTSAGERVALYSQKDMMVNSENNLNHHVGKYQHAQIGRMSLTTVGRLPGGGGSGGGGSIDTSATVTTTKDDKGNLVQTPKGPGFSDWKSSNGLLSGQPGLAGTTVFGINLQDTVGLLHQFTIGAAYQFCIGIPGVAWGFLPSALKEPSGGTGFGAAFGGNVQMFWGTNTQATYGTSINITHGPVVQVTGKWGPDLTDDVVDPTWPTVLMAVLLPCVCAAYEIVYLQSGNWSDADTKRENMIEIFTGVIALTTGLLLASELVDKAKSHAKDVTKKADDTKEQVETITKTLGLKNPKLIAAASKTLIDHTTALEVATRQGPMTPLDKACRVSYVEGTSLETAGNIYLLSRHGAKDPGSSIIQLNAVGSGKDGVLFLNATQSVTIQCGYAVAAFTKKDTDNGEITVTCGKNGRITLQRDQLPVPPPQMIDMQPGMVTISGGSDGLVNIKSGKLPPLQGCFITLDPSDGILLACGQNSIQIDQKGVTINCLMHETNAKISKKETTQIHQMQSTLAKMGITINQMQ